MIYTPRGWNLEDYLLYPNIMLWENNKNLYIFCVHYKLFKHVGMKKVPNKIFSFNALITENIKQTIFFTQQRHSLSR